MKYIKGLLPGLFVLLLNIWAVAQNHYHIQLVPLQVSPVGQACFTTQLSGADTRDLNLAGQNYRLYYDSEKFRFNNGSSLLPKAKYTHLVIKDNLVNIDAKGTGSLSFEDHLGFLNLGIDLENIQNGGTILPANGDWVSTAQICFDNLSEQADLKDFRLNWARKELTENYATAFVEIAEWIHPYKTMPAMAEKYYDLDLITSNQVLKTSPLIYPNPTHSKLWITTHRKEKMRLEIWDMSGRHLIERIVPSNAAGYEVDMEEYPAGMYQVKLSLDKKYFTELIEKIH